MTTFLQSIKNGLEEKMLSDPKVFFLGEDICDPYGGAFKLSMGLSSKFPDRVINTPMSEWALTGVVAGMAIKGLRPVLEIMFGDFITLCADQLINHAAKFKWMYNGNVTIPMVIRSPMGGRRGYGPTHSQTIEKIFLGIPGIKVVAPSHIHNPGELLKKAIDDNDVVLFIENKSLYGKKLLFPEKNSLTNYFVQKSKETYETISMSYNDFDTADVTLLTYGGMLPLVLEASKIVYDKYHLHAEIIVPSNLNCGLYPELVKSLKKTGCLVVVEEGTRRNGWGAEMSALLSSEHLDLLELPIRRVAAKEMPVGCSKPLEDFVLPQVSDIVSEIIKGRRL